MNGDLASAAINLLAAGNSFSTTQTIIETMSPNGSGEDSFMTALKNVLIAQAILPPQNRASWYVSASPQFSVAEGSPGLSAPNGPFNTSPYTANSCTLTGGQADNAGGTTASKVTLTAATAAHSVTRGFTGTTFGLYVKAGTAAFVGLSFDGGTNAQVYNLTTGALSTVVGTVVANISPLTTSGWYVITLSAAAGTTVTIAFGDTAGHAVPGTSWAAAGTETVFLYNVQGA